MAGGVEFMTELQRPLSQSDIADRFGVALSTVSTWLTRHGPDAALPFPAPDSPAGVLPYWWPARWPEIQQWRRQLGQRPRRTPWPPEGLVTASGVGVWISRSGTWVRKACEGTLTVHEPFPPPSAWVLRGTTQVALWSACMDREKIVRWYEAYLDSLPRSRQRRRRPTFVTPPARRAPGGEYCHKCGDEPVTHVCAREGCGCPGYQPALPPSTQNFPRSNTPPAVRWIAEGPHAGVFLYDPGTGLWAHLRPNCGTAMLVRLPVGTEPLYSVHDVELALDAYRTELPAAVQLKVDYHHVETRDSVIAEMIDAAGYAEVAADLRHMLPGPTD